mmetsp:Transcript_24108/g.50737  ORF Transcript_24108/g.50737 Transcript_24108/m.50737 type:complete len:243 (+) Transcript_24108:741-1469(+)
MIHPLLDGGESLLWNYYFSLGRLGRSTTILPLLLVIHGNIIFLLDLHLLLQMTCHISLLVIIILLLLRLITIAITITVTIIVRTQTSTPATAQHPRDTQLIQNRLQIFQRVLQTVVPPPQRPVPKIELKHFFQQTRYHVSCHADGRHGERVGEGVGSARHGVAGELMAEAYAAREVFFVGEYASGGWYTAFRLVLFSGGSTSSCWLIRVGNEETGSIGGDQSPVLEEMAKRLELGVIFHFVG